MFKKYFIIAVTLFMIAPSILADRLDDAVRASNFEDVNYLLIMKGGAVSQHRKDELVMLANEMTLVRKRGTIPVIGTVWDAYTTAKGVAASVIAYKCVRKIMAIEIPNFNDELELGWAVLRCYFFGIPALIGAGYGIYNLVQGVRSAHGRNLFDQATQIEKRINELKVVGDSLPFVPKN